jgi:NAD(P)-dependent dehydrogenase (short-subunit alcohol dehydrogenase family)
MGPNLPARGAKYDQSLVDKRRKDMKVSGKVIVVTGGGSGIGQALVLELLERGAKVAAADIRQEGLDETIDLANAGDRLATFVADVTDREVIGALPDKVIEAHGAVDAVVSNAGIIQPMVKLNDLEYDTIDRVINVNLYGTIHMVKSFLPHLLKRPVAHIATVSSMGGFLPFPGQTIYGAAKAGVKLLTEGLYAELLDTNVGVSVVFPGPTESNIGVNSGIDMPPDASADASSIPTTSAPDAARAIVEGIENEDFHIVIGGFAKVANLAVRVAPKRATHLLYRQMKSLLSN